MAKRIKVLESAVLYDDCDINYTEWYADFIDWCEDNNIDHTKHDEYSNLFHDWVNNTLSMEWDDMLCNIKHSKYNEECVVVGSLGLWYGRPTIEPTRFNDIISALNECAIGADMLIVKLINGCIDVVGIHHDGRNHFQIHCLNKLGKKTEGANLNNDRYYLKIKGWFE